MLYESTYNQYFLEHSWGPWKKHLYISRDGESGKFTYKYPKEYYDKYKQYKRTTAATSKGALMRGDTDRAIDYAKKVGYNAERKADENAEYYNEYYDSDFDKVINRSVKAAVNALNFGVDMKNKAEGYLNRFANAVADAWNGAKSPDRTRVQAGKQFVSNLWDSLSNTVTAKKVSSSIQNLVKGAGELVKKTWDDVKNSKTVKKAERTVDRAKETVANTARSIADNLSPKRKAGAR